MKILFCSYNKPSKFNIKNLLVLDIIIQLKYWIDTIENNNKTKLFFKKKNDYRRIFQQSKLLQNDIFELCTQLGKIL